jgi:hypothetical protein
MLASPPAPRTSNRGKRLVEKRFRVEVVLHEGGCGSQEQEIHLAIPQIRELRYRRIGKHDLQSNAGMTLGKLLGDSTFQGGTVLEHFFASPRSCF